MDRRPEDTSSGVVEESASALSSDDADVAVSTQEIPEEPEAVVEEAAVTDGAVNDTAPETGESPQDPPKKSRTLRIVLLIVCLMVAAACGIFLLVNVSGKQSSPGIRLPDNPVDFAALQEENPEIVAWISIPNTQVDCPVLRSAVDDFYYLNHDEYCKYAIDGSIFMEMINSADFSDPVTVLYGHNATDGSRFTTLHYFENAQFFRENENMSVYTPGHILTYRIIAAYIYDDRHILNSFNFSILDERASYFQKVLSPTSMVANVREGATLSVDDKILQLSTCMDAILQSNQRLIVTGVLVDDQATV